MKCILIVDDTEVNLKVLEVLLTRNGYDIISALSGKEALRLLKMKSFDLIISDILMPEMDGFQFCRFCKLDENLKHIPFVFYSSTHTEAKARELARKVGGQAFITKPADPAMLLKIIDKILCEYDHTSPAKQKNSALESHQPYSELFETMPERENSLLTGHQQTNNTLLENVPCVVWTIDSWGEITYVSSAVEGITGFTRNRIQEMGKRGWLDRIPSFDVGRVQEAYKNLFQNKIPLDIEYQFECRNGDHIWFHEKLGSPYKKKEKLYSDGVSIDISEKKYLQTHFLKSRETEVSKTLALGMAHDLNNFLTGIAGYIELSNMASPNPLEREDLLSKALKICYSASELTSDFFALSSIRKPVKDSRLLGDVITHVANPLFDKSDINYKVEVPPDLWACRVESKQMARAVENIIINALEAVLKDGFIEVILQNVSIEKKEFCSGCVVDPGHYIKTTIRDNGRGIDRKNLHQIFYPYYSTKPSENKKGVGLGLSLSEAIISRHGGVIAVNSQKGLGTTMDIYLPALKPGEEYTLDTSERMPSQYGSLLVMDEDEMVREITRQVLERAGFDVTCVKDGSEAVKVYEQAMAAHTPFSAVILALVICDDEMAGVKTLEQLRKINPRIKAAVSSGYPSDPVVKHYKKYGFHTAVSKPYFAKELVKIVKSLLSS